MKCLQSQVAAFCEKYNLDSSRCSEELWNFSTAYKRFNFMQPNSISEDESDCSTMDEEDGEENRSDNFNLNLSFSAALTLLCNPKYHQVPELSKAYSIALAIPISSCTAERSFSALKRVKTRLRSTMMQERLDGLLLIAVERKILKTINSDAIID